VGRYCDRMGSAATGAVVWGGHPELRALSATLGVPIVVYQAGAPPLEFTPAGEERRNPAADGRRGGEDDWRLPPGDVKLRLSFHRHYYALGEHYNSVVDGAGGPPR
jgi:OTU domain-containing protein 6